MRRIAACLALFAAAAAWAQSPASPPPAQPAVQPPRVAATIADAAWLQGYWLGEGFGGTCEDFWMPPAKGVMFGGFRLTKSDGSKEFYELLGIEEFEGSLRIVVKHFNPDWVGWEEKDQAHKFRLTKLTAEELVFGALSFQRTAPDAFTFRLAMRQKEGPPKVETVPFRKKAL
jgi:hypothetical protein